MSNEWKLVRLGDCANMYQPKTISQEDLIEDGEFLVYGANGIIGRYDKFNHEAPQLLITCRGATCGTVNISEAKSWITGNSMVVKPNERDIDMSYLKYYLRQSQLMTQVITGAAQPQITRANLSLLKISFPKSLICQKEIARILDKASELIEKRKEQLRELDALAESVFQDMFGDPVTNEKGWEKRPIEKLVIKDKNAIKAGPFGSSLKKESYTESGYKIYGQEQVLSGNCNYGNYFVSEEKYNELSSCKVGYDDVLISLVGSYGKTLVIPKDFQEGIINPRLMKISFDQAQILPMFFCFIFGMDVFQMYLANITHGGTMPILNVGTVKKIGIALPPLFLQQQFAAIIEKIEEQKAKVKEALKESEDLFQRLMQDLFNPDQD